jgi:hypothetical protein
MITIIERLLLEHAGARGVDLHPTEPTDG